MKANAETHARKARQRRLEILDIIADFWDDNGVGPTIDEVTKLSEYGRNAVVRYIRVLRDEGTLEPNDGKHRQLRPAP